MLLTGQQARDMMKSAVDMIEANAQTIQLQGKSITLMSEVTKGNQVIGNGMLPAQFKQTIDTFAVGADTTNRLSLGIAASGKPDTMNLFLERTADGDVVLMITRATKKGQITPAELAEGMRTGIIPGVETQTVEYTGPTTATQHQLTQAVKRAVREKSPYKAFSVPNFTFGKLKAGS